jgi:hypothetical protein
MIDIVILLAVLLTLLTVLNVLTLLKSTLIVDFLLTFFRAIYLMFIISYQCQRAILWQKSTLAIYMCKYSYITRLVC